MFSTCICKDNTFINMSIVLWLHSQYFEFFGFLKLLYFFYFILQYYFIYIDNHYYNIFINTIFLINFIFQ